LEIARALEDRSTAARALSLLGLMELVRDPQQARMLLEESVAALETTEDRWCAAFAHGLLAMSWAVQCALDPARVADSVAEKALMVCESDSFRAWHWLRRAVVALRGGELDEAERALHQADGLAAEVGDRICQGW